MERPKSGIFYDSANLDGLRSWYRTGVLGGATTNPVILQNDGVLDVPGHIQEMIDIVGEGFPISIEIPDSTMSAKEMINLAFDYHAKFPNNAVIKVPMDPRTSRKVYGVMNHLAEKGVAVNATLGLTSGQLIAAAEALRNAEESYVSLFWGRCEEAGGIGAEKSLLSAVEYLRSHDLNSKIIVGSIRNAEQIDTAFRLGADIVTIPLLLLEEWLYTKRGEETADQFNKAYREVKDKMKLI